MFFAGSARARILRDDTRVTPSLGGRKDATRHSGPRRTKMIHSQPPRVSGRTTPTARMRAYLAAGYARRPEVRNVQTKMLGIYPTPIADGLQERCRASPVALLADDARRGPFSAARAMVNTRPGAYDRDGRTAPRRLRRPRHGRAPRRSRSTRSAPPRAGEGAINLN